MRVRHGDDDDSEQRESGQSERQERTMVRKKQSKDKGDGRETTSRRQQ